MQGEVPIRAAALLFTAAHPSAQAKAAGEASRLLAGRARPRAEIGAKRRPLASAIICAALAGLATALAAPSPAHASPITATISNNHGGALVQSGQPITGTFDLTSWLADYALSDFSIHFQFGDDSDAVLTSQELTGGYVHFDTQVYYYPYSCGFFSTCYYTYVYRYFRRPGTEIWFDEPETAYLSIGGEEYSAASAWFEQTQQRTTSDGTTSTQYENSTVIDSYYTVWSRTTSGYRGGFSITQSLGEMASADLLSDGLLDYSVFAGSDFHFFRAELSFTATPLSSSDADVPEPALAALFALGLAGLSLARRGNRRGGH